MSENDDLTVKKIVFVDDNAGERHLFSKAIKDSGKPLHVTMAEGGEQLMHYLEQLDGELPDLILLDLLMPQMNGIECLQEIRMNKRFDEMPVFIYSVIGDKKDIDNAYKYGANLYVLKPMFIDDEKRLLEEILSLDKKMYSRRLPREDFLLKSQKLHKKLH